MTYDLFISHASEDKSEFVRELAQTLIDRGFRVWFDEFEITLGDSLRESIDQGLAKSAFGVVVLSRSFFAKQWTQLELNALFAKESHGGKKVILPLWHNVERSDVLAFSPMLADKYALSTNKMSVEKIADQIARVVEKARGK